MFHIYHALFYSVGRHLHHTVTMYSNITLCKHTSISANCPTKILKNQNKLSYSDDPVRVLNI